jgi:hypothetical protein
MFNGYICNYDAIQDGTGSGDRRGGQFQINRIDNEAASTLATADVRLVPGKAYRMTLQGVGSRLTAKLYDLEDLTSPIVMLRAEDAQWTAGVPGLIAFSREGKTADASFDNFYAGVTDPNSDVAPATRHSIPETPQVVTRTPAARFANFHPAASGISFTAKTFSTNTIGPAATRLFLNGIDVSSSLAPLPSSGDTATFSIASGALESNMVYAARIELWDTAKKLSSTNTFWFDTFSESYLAASPVKLIEAEDYNYVGGQFQLDPIPLSGRDTNGIAVSATGVGYADQVGIADVDYHDVRTSTEGGWNDYRSEDFVGTIQGISRTSTDPQPLRPGKIHRVRTIPLELSMLHLA